MPAGLRRNEHTGHQHFLTFSCWQRRPYLGSAAARELFEQSLEEMRLRYDFLVVGYVVMPEHVHLLVGEPQQERLADALKALKQGVSRQLIGKMYHFWQKRYYDFNIRDHQQFIEKLRYIHRKPVKRELGARPEDWEWSTVFFIMRLGKRGA